jgi:hypothetical protein
MMGRVKIWGGRLRRLIGWVLDLQMVSLRDLSRGATYFNVTAADTGNSRRGDEESNLLYCCCWYSRISSGHFFRRRLWEGVVAIGELGESFGEEF